MLVFSHPHNTLFEPKIKAVLFNLKMVPKPVVWKTYKSNPFITGMGCLMFAHSTTKWELLIFLACYQVLGCLPMFRFY